MHARTIMLALGLALAACNTASKETKSSEPTAAAPAAVREVSVSDVANFIQAKSATIVDANGAETREKMGVVPGAILLTNSHDYALSELPAAKDTKLVFYCGGTMCRASDSAAKRAASAGYADVSVMRAGIKGWKDAGQTTEMPRS
ncbi:MAG TPA: rhodanese-like domain-containing protein [Polyangiaceae bacterium]|nr:rhodanese-like domain-containing protein [Polyangiaceae bacterium]